MLNHAKLSKIPKIAQKKAKTFNKTRGKKQQKIAQLGNSRKPRTLPKGVFLMFYMAELKQKIHQLVIT